MLQLLVPLNGDMAKTCACMAAGLAPEAIKFDPVTGIAVEGESAKNQLRPEAVESFWHMWRLTGDAKYREWGWAVFQAFQHSRGKVAFHGIQVCGSSHAVSPHRLWCA